MFNIRISIFLTDFECGPQNCKLLSRCYITKVWKREKDRENKYKSNIPIVLYCDNTSLSPVNIFFVFYLLEVKLLSTFVVCVCVCVCLIVCNCIILLRVDVEGEKKREYTWKFLYKFTTNSKGESKSVFKYLRIKNQGTGKMCTCEGK